MQTLVVEFCGWTGTAGVFVWYFLISQGYLDGSGIAASVFSIGMALLIGINSFAHHALPNVGLQVGWALIAVFAIAKVTRSRSRRGRLCYASDVGCPMEAPCDPAEPCELRNSIATPGNPYDHGACLHGHQDHSQCKVCSC